MGSSKLFLGDSIEILKQIEANSIDSLVTDPPAAIEFMGKEWDGDKGGRTQWIAWLASVLNESMRTLKPGSHALVWALPRMSHWTMMAVEDAGFEIRDTIIHLFSQGMPKSMDIAKAIDKASGTKGSYGEIKSEQHAAWVKRGHVISEGSNEGWERPWMADPEAIEQNARKYISGSEAARLWQGWGTALKPGAEYWILARKPIAEKTLTANIVKHGAGGINIEESRTDRGGWPYNVILSHDEGCVLKGKRKVKSGTAVEPPEGQVMNRSIYGATKTLGRECTYADENGMEEIDAYDCTETCPIGMLDKQSGTLKSGKPGTRKKPHETTSMSGRLGLTGEIETGYGDSGGASRFYYCPKAPKKDKGTNNDHPTVKNTVLMEYLIRLITPSDGIILDPFMGSGSTGVAAVRGGWGFIGIELSPEYFEIAKRRISEEE
jgi:DNA modification methylase